MPAINLPWSIQNGDPLDADQVMANFGTIVSLNNGGLEMGSNVKADGPNVPITGKDSSEGTSVSGLRSDAQFVIQGFENVTAKPTSGNFLGRCVYVTAGADIGKAFLCTDANTPVWKAWGNPGATDLPTHGSQHGSTGIDPLPNNGLSDAMKGTAAITTAQLSGTSADFSTSSWTTIQDMPITTVGAQTLFVSMNIRVKNSNGSANTFRFRVLDQTAAATQVFLTQSWDLAANTSIVVFPQFFYTVPVAGGARTLRLQGAANLANLNAFAPTGGDPTYTMSAVVI